MPYICSSATSNVEEYWSCWAPATFPYACTPAGRFITDDQVAYLVYIIIKYHRQDPQVLAMASFASLAHLGKNPDTPEADLCGRVLTCSALAEGFPEQLFTGSLDSAAHNK